MNPLMAMYPGRTDKTEYPFPPEKYINCLLMNNLSLYSNKSFKSLGFYRNGSNVDVETEYQYNSFGYRSNEWNDHCDVLAVGCSNTMGLGIPVEHSWPQILSKIINKDVRTLSRSGGSILDLVQKTFAYFREFGNPKTIFCLFPEPFRLMIPGNKRLASSKYLQDGIITDTYLESFGYDQVSSRPKYSKQPHEYKDIIPMEVPLFFAAQSIHALEQYCRANNIELFWSCWQPDFSNLLNTIEEKVFTNFIYDENFLISSGTFDAECHKEYPQDALKYFKIGLDNEDDPRSAHPGVHKHIHIAESFYKKIGEHK